MITITVQGTAEYVDFMKNASEAVMEAASDGIYDWVAGVGSVAVEEAPLGPTGNLRGSWFENEPELVGDVISVICGFSIYYAVYVHENLQAHHRIGKAKFLEDPMQRHAPDLPEFLASRITEALQEVTA